MANSFEIKIARQAWLEALPSHLPLDFCLNEALREHHVGAGQRGTIRDIAFKLARFWMLFFSSSDEFTTENPAWLRRLDEALRSCAEMSVDELRRKHSQIKPRPEKDPAAHLRAAYPIKSFLFEEMKEQPELWQAFLASQLEAAPFTVRIRPDLVSREDFLGRYAQFDAKASAWLPDAVHFGRHWSVENDEWHGKGFFEVQDEHSQLVSHIARPLPGERVLDLCAGGGGKTLHMAALMQNRGEIVAHDLSPKKLQRLSERARRAACTNLRLSATLPTDRQSYDLVLIDAPCTGLGTLRRGPDRLLQLRPTDLTTLSRVQLQLLQQAAYLVRPGGRIVYATCSVRPAENHRLIETFLKDEPRFQSAKIEAALRAALGGAADNFLTLAQSSPAFALSELSNLNAGIQLCQTSGGLVGDGFFIAQLGRVFI